MMRQIMSDSLKKNLNREYSVDVIHRERRLNFLLNESW